MDTVSSFPGPTDWVERPGAAGRRLRLEFARALDPESAVTISTAAELLGMSRAHLTRLADTGRIPSHFDDLGVRHLRAGGLATLADQLQEDRRALTESFSNADAIEAVALDELARVL